MSEILLQHFVRLLHSKIIVNLITLHIVMCGCVFVGGVLAICVLVFTVFLLFVLCFCIVCTVFWYCFVYVHLFSFVLSVLV